MIDSGEGPPDYMDEPAWCECGWRESDPTDPVEKCPDCEYRRMSGDYAPNLDRLNHRLQDMPDEAGPWSWHPEVKRQVKELDKSELLGMATDVRNEQLRDDLLMPEVKRRITEFSAEEIATLLQNPDNEWREAVIQVLGRRRDC